MEKARSSELEPISEALMDQAGKLEYVMQRLIVAENNVFAREVAHFGLTVPQYVTLVSIERTDNGTDRMGRIADMSGQCSATMTGIIDRLEGMGLARRRDNPGDRRSKLIELTDAGRERLETVRVARQERLAQMLAGMDESIRSQAYEVISVYTNALEKLTE